MKEEDKIEYKQRHIDQVKAMRGEVDCLEKRHLRDKNRLKSDFTEMDELLEDLRDWRKQTEEARGAPSLYLT